MNDETFTIDPFWRERQEEKIVRGALDIRIKFEELMDTMRVIAFPKRGTGEEYMSPDEVFNFAQKKYRDFQSWYEEFMKAN